MNIEVEESPTHKGDIYMFTLEFQLWLSKELGRLVRESEAFIKKFGMGWRLTLAWEKGKRIKTPRFTGPWVDRKYKGIRWVIEVPRVNYDSPRANSYVPMLRQYLEGIIAILTREQVDASKIRKAMPLLLKRFASEPGMLEYDPHPLTFGTLEDPYGMNAEAAVFAQPTAKPKTPAKFLKRKLPKWKIPKNFLKLVEEDGMWEYERFDPILLTVMSGTSYRDREIPLAWQIEFEPGDRQFAPANAKIAASGIEPDGEGWAEVIGKQFAKRYGRLAAEFHSDSESSACVTWVESEEACKRLIGLVWSLIYPK